MGFSEAPAGFSEKISSVAVLSSVKASSVRVGFLGAPEGVRSL
jgi:hypothetical protein